MKSSELVRIAQKYGWKLTNQGGTSHREYEKNGNVFREKSMNYLHLTSPTIEPQLKPMISGR
jgi:hypothetical protein